MPCCVAEEYDNWCDDVGILVEHEGQEYCIFHAPAECQEKLDRWLNKLVYERIDRADTNCNLSGTIFPLEISFKRYDQRNQLPEISFQLATFSGVTFSGDADFTEATFSAATSFRSATFNAEAIFNDVIFSAVANFSGATFSAATGFIEATFNSGAHFFGATFSADPDFSESTFSADAYFNKATFSGTAYFIDTTFSADTGFIEATFSAVANFSGATFSAVADFARATFSGTAYFIDTTFSAVAKFDLTHFVDSSVFDSVDFHTAGFTHTKFEKPAFFRQTFFARGHFQGCHIGSRLEFDRANLGGLSLLGAPIESFRFISCSWPKTNTRNIVFDARLVEGQGYFEIHNMDKVAPFVRPEDMPTPTHLEDLFRRLKKVAKSENDEMMASDWHYNEKEMQRLRLTEPDANLKLSGKLRNSFLFQILTAYKIFSGYGEEPLRALLWLLALALIPLVAETPHTPEIFPGKMLYYLPLVKARAAINDFSTCTHLWMITWQLLITVQAALFGFALRNKFRR